MTRLDKNYVTMSIQELEQEIQYLEKEYKAEKLDENLRRLFENYRGDDEIIDIEKARELINEKIEKEKNNFKIFSNIIPLDRISGGFQAGNLVLITGQTGQGKTTFAQTLTKNFSDNGFFSLWFTYEVILKDFIDKFGDNLPCCCVPKQLKTSKLTWIERKIVEAIVKFDIKVVFIDHLHYLLRLNENQNISFAIGEVMKILKGIAIKYNIVVILIAHLTKVKTEEAVKLEDIRDSSFIAQYSNFIMAIWRKTFEARRKRDIFENGVLFKNEARLSVLKNSFNGRLGGFNLMHNDLGMFEFVEEKEEVSL
jgi:replicative DNA helicase